MAAGNITHGRRLPDVTWDEAAGWTGWNESQPGDYVKVVNAPAGLVNASTPGAGWYIRDPCGSIGSLRSHTVVEHEDGTITVSPSILDVRTFGDGGWHGYLERGVWREV